MKNWIIAMLSLGILAGVCATGWIHVRHKKVEAERAAYKQKIDDCIVAALRKNHASLKLDERKSRSGEPMTDVFDQVAEDMEVEQARDVCISNDAYAQQHKHDRELYEKAFPGAVRAH